MVKSLDERLNDHTLPDVYLDANIMIMGLFEWRDKIQQSAHFISRHKSQYLDEINNSKIIMEQWNPLKMFISFYGITETIQVCRNEYEITLEDVVKAIFDDIDEKYTVTTPTFDFFKGQSPLVSLIEKKIPNPSEYGKQELTREVYDEKKRYTETVQEAYYWYSGARIDIKAYRASDMTPLYQPVQGTIVGMPPMYQPIQGKIVNDIYSSMKYDRELFLRSIEIAEKYPKIKMKDAIHILIAQSIHAYFITTEKGILNSGLTNVFTPTQLFEKYLKKS